jgi:signal transduction histidine kinase
LTTQLLGFARKGKYNITRLPVEELFDSCLTMLSPDTMKNVKITTSCNPTQILAADVVQLNQALLNLLLNAKDALKESKKENLTIHLSAEDTIENYPDEKVPPHLANQELKNYLCLSVADNGCGMSEETIAKVFEPFFTTKPVGLGTGMGLAMVYGTINNHKGWIRVESTVGVGTTFRLFLPKYIDIE